MSRSPFPQPLFNSFLPAHYVNATFPPSTFAMTSSFLKSLQYISRRIILFLYMQTVGFILTLIL